MASKKKQEPETPVVIPVGTYAARFIQELFTRTELERAMAMNEIRAALSVPLSMVYDPRQGAFVDPQPTGPELLSGPPVTQPI